MIRVAVAAVRQAPIGSAFSYKQDYVNEAYTASILSLGHFVAILPYTSAPDAPMMLDGFDALLLPGGEDIDPIIYGEEERYAINRDAELDRYHIALIHAAMSQKIPILGICRGLHLINVALGGTLWQDLKRENPTSINHLRLDIPHGIAHEVRVEENSFFHRALKRRTLEVNSLHHQGIQKLGFGLKATAIAPDGVIEGFESEGMVGVQWHPEAMGEDMAPLFKTFLEEYVG